MGKSTKKRKRQRLMADAALPPAAAPPAAAPPCASDTGGPLVTAASAASAYRPLPLTQDALGGLPAADVAATVRTLQVSMSTSTRARRS
jgi:hypothetical protein